MVVASLLNDALSQPLVCWTVPVPEVNESVSPTLKNGMTSVVPLPVAVPEMAFFCSTIFPLFIIDPLFATFPVPIRCNSAFSEMVIVASFGIVNVILFGTVSVTPLSRTKDSFALIVKFSMRTMSLVPV